MSYYICNKNLFKKLAIIFAFIQFIMNQFLILFYQVVLEPTNFTIYPGYIFTN